MIKEGCFVSRSVNGFQPGHVLTHQMLKTSYDFPRELASIIYSEYDNEKQNDFGDLFYDLEITIPEIQLKSIIRLENMVYKGNHHILSPTLNVGNVYFVTNFRTSKYGFLFGEQPEVNIDKPEQLETACYIGIPKLTLQSAFKMRVFHEDILIFEGIVDASQAYTY